MRPELLDTLSLYHETSYERLNLARKQIKELGNCDISISFVMSNDEDLSNRSSVCSKLDKNEHQHLIYVLAIALFSALESMLQEVNLVCGLGCKKVNYKLLEEIPTRYDNLMNVCIDISKNENFIYLRDLRNLLAHRRITLLVSDVRYDLPQRNPFRPYIVKGKCINYLPDKPLVVPGEETFSQKKEVKRTLEGLHNYICEAKERIYQALAVEVTKC